MNNNKTTSYRQERVASLITEAIVQYFSKGQLIDKRLISMPCTITKVEVTSDLKIARCYFIPFNTKLTHTEILEALNNSKYAIRSFVTEKIALRYSPEIRFSYDLGFHNANLIQEILDKV